MKSVAYSHLTGRQQRELDYHREHASENRRILEAPFSWDVVQNPHFRWWNAYWAMYAHIRTCEIRGKRVLVVGCGLGEDALRLAKIGAIVTAFDLSPESLIIAKELASREGLQITFDEMPAENLAYANSVFDFVVARDIFHHVDVKLAMREIERVARPGAILIVNEIYSHTWTGMIRNSRFIERIVYPKMQRLIYGGLKPYITEDEKKLDQHELKTILHGLQPVQFEKHFNCLVTRIFPDRFTLLNKLDHLLLIALRPFGRILAGRILFSARILK